MDHFFHCGIFVKTKRMRLLIIDNFDSFTWNLHHELHRWVHDVLVLRNDEVTEDAVLGSDGVVLSPGPGLPAEAGRMPEVIKKFVGVRPFLGVCLGHQALAEYFGASLLNLDGVLHGLAGSCTLSESDPLFDGVRQPFEIGHYHSWIVDDVGFPDALKVLARSDKGHIMALRHRSLPVYGVQFHPESVLTPYGSTILRNWCDQVVIKNGE
jgi:anthranilate synthase component 2